MLDQEQIKQELYRLQDRYDEAYSKWNAAAQLASNARAEITSIVTTRRSLEEQLIALHQMPELKPRKT